MLYPAIRSFLQFVIRHFFTKIRRNGSVPVEQGPVLIVGNHENFLIDSLLIATAFRRPLWFLAKSTLFVGEPINTILRLLHLVPVKRRQDFAGAAVDNQDVFRFAADTLSEGKAIAMFPEGVSLGERKLQPLKTGAARIALLAASERNFSLGLRIQPVGLTYSDPDQYQSSVSIYFGEPIAVDELRQEYENDAINAARLLTARIEAALQDLTVNLSNVEHEELVERISKLYAHRDVAGGDLERFKVIAKNVEVLAPGAPEKKQEIERRLRDYLALSEAFGFSGAETLAPREHPILLSLLAPVVLTGIVYNYPPYALTGPLARKFSAYPVALGSMKLAVGIVLFAVWYLLTAFVFSCLTGSFVLGFLGLVLLLILGSITGKFADRVKLFLLTCLWPGSRNPVAILHLMREELVKDLEAMRVQ